MGCGPSKTQRVIKSSSFQEDENVKGNDNVVLSESNHDNQGLKGFVRSKPTVKTPKMMSSPMLAQLQRTPSQVEFFEKLDEKINKGEDDCPSSEMLEEFDEEIEKAIES